MIQMKTKNSNDDYNLSWLMLYDYHFNYPWGFGVLGFWGFVGILLSIPVSVALVEFLDDTERRKRFKPEAAPIEIGVVKEDDGMRG